MDWKSKLTSRKFWVAVVNFVTQLMFAFKCTESEVAQVAAVIMAGAGVVAYIIGEGLADAAGASGDVIIEDTKPPAESAPTPPIIHREDVTAQYFESGAE